MPFIPHAPSLRDRLDARLWSADWPVMAASPVVDASHLPAAGWWESWPDVWASAQALEGHRSVSLGSAHAFLDRLERWTQSHQQQLTWPPTDRGFAQALVTSLAARDPDALAVLAHCPGGCLAILEAHSDLAADIPDHSKSLITSLRRLVFPAPATLVPPVSASASVSPTASSAPSPEREPRPRTEPPAAAPHLVSWLKDLVLELRESGGNAAVKSARIDEAFKHLRLSERADAHKGWFEEVLLPVLAQQDAVDLKALLDNWPSHHHFGVGDPVSFAGAPRLWAILRDAPAPDVLLAQGLPQWVDSASWSFEQRYAMLEPMFKLVRTNEKKFRQRLALWEGWGGNLDQEGVLGSCAPADVFAAAPEPVSARGWFLSQKIPMWNEVLEAPAAPASSPRSRARP